jgi:acyl-CoA reductase-like NAD-dependent aldehyde dehydrogenase
MAILEQLDPTSDGRHRYSLKNPATLEPIGEITCANSAEVQAAVERGRKAQLAWGALSFKQRGEYMERMIKVVLAHQDEIAETVARETGKAPFEAYASEMPPVCDVLQYYAKHAGKFLKDRSTRLHLLGPFKKLRLTYRPLGVVGIIIPWNFPFIMGLNPTVQALMAGNTVVLKPSEVTPFSAQLLGKLFQEAGLPSDVFQVVVGDGEVGAALCQADIDKIHFTGSVATGKKVGEACGQRLLPCTLELGGKDPAIVCADADLERAVCGVVNGAFFNTGQTCASVERVYVVDSVADSFIDKVVTEVKQMRQSDCGECEVGSMIWDPQLLIVEQHVEDARNKGATVLTGGRRNPNLKGFFFEPTVLTDVSHDMKIMTEETFGPVLPIMRVRDEAEAVELANDSNYGLSASVWTQDKERGFEIAKQIRAGSAVVNDFGGVVYGATEASFGGRRDSGIGQVNGEIGLRSFCQAQHILVHRFGPKKEQAWFPYEEKKLDGLKKFVNFFWGTRIGRWMS